MYSFAINDDGADTLFRAPPPFLKVSGFATASRLRPWSRYKLEITCGPWILKYPQSWVRHLCGRDDARRSDVIRTHTPRACVAHAVSPMTTTWLRRMTDTIPELIDEYRCRRDRVSRECQR